MTIDRRWKSISYVSILAVSMLLLPTASMGQSPDLGVGFLQIKPEEAGKSPLTTQPKAGQIAVTTNTVELQEAATGEIKVNAGTPKSIVKPAAQAKKLVVQEAKSLISSELQKTKGKPIQIDIINDQKGTTQKLEISNANDPKINEALSKALNPPSSVPQASELGEEAELGEQAVGICYPHVHVTFHKHSWWWVPWVHIHIAIHIHCI